MDLLHSLGSSRSPAPARRRGQSLPKRLTHADFCRPFHDSGALVEAVRSQLCARAQALGWTLRHDPLADLHLVVDGVRIDPSVRDQSVRFTVPAGSRDVWLASQATRLLDVGTGSDCRALGVCLGKLLVDDGFTPAREISLDDSLLSAGFHDVERGEDFMWRWTAGRAQLPAALWADHGDGFFLRVDLAGPALPKWVAPAVGEAGASTQAA